MEVSEARREANRRNAARSTGPKTPGGKLASRGNALKHGMTGSGAVMKGGDAAEVARRSEALVAELGPTGELGRALVRRVALHSVRMERAAIQEAAALAARGRAATLDFDDRRAAEVEAAFAGLATDAPDSARRLRRMPEGVDRMIATWQALAADLRRPGIWDEARARMVDHLMGRSPFEVSASPAAELSRAILQDPAGTTVARSGLLELVDREVARLQAHRPTLDPETIALDRLDAPDVSLFDPSWDATLARRYEAAAERGFYKGLVELGRIESAAIDLAPLPTPIPSPLDPWGSVGSIRRVPAPTPPPASIIVEPEPRPSIDARLSRPAPIQSRPRGTTNLDFAIGLPGVHAVIESSAPPRPRV